ncbi:MAG: NAD(+) diphosphatase [Acidimicrobiaceae bacterium]|nr:NAD(+) diphosphatase [Acidimicrobiaceae bacterium]
MPIFTHLVSVPDDTPPTARWYLVRRDEILVDEDTSVPAPLKGPESLPLSSSEDPVVIGWMDEELCWALGVDGSLDAPAGYRWAHLRELGGAWPTEEWALAGRAVQLVEWRRTHRYCGRCGHETEPSPGERAMRCPSCGLLAFPVVSPAVIVLVRKGEQILLAANRTFRGGMYSILAGFVEPGENIEETLHREVFEEVGIHVKNLRYVASQPWPFPHSLMIGYTAEWESGEIQPDGDEILDAGWYSADDLPPIPPPLSIAGRLINDWIREVQGGTRA